MTNERLREILDTMLNLCPEYIGLQGKVDKECSNPLNPDMDCATCWAKAILAEMNGDSHRLRRKKANHLKIGGSE